MWRLKVTRACHDRHGMSWAKQGLEVTALVFSAWGPLSHHSCWSIETVKAPSRTFAYRGGNSGEGDQEGTEDRQGLFFPLSSVLAYLVLCVCVSVCFVLSHITNTAFFYKLKFCSNTAWSKSISAIFPKGSDDG